MPTYDYECRSCNHTFEAFQSMKDNALTQCPQCGKDELRRLIGGGTGIIFKGSGFYVNDSRKNSSSIGTSAKSSGASKSSDTSAAGGSQTSSSSSEKKGSSSEKSI